MKKQKTSKDVNKLFLMNVQNICSMFYLGNIIYVAKLPKSLLSNNNGILHFSLKEIIQ